MCTRGHGHLRRAAYPAGLGASRPDTGAWPPALHLEHRFAPRWVFGVTSTTRRRDPLHGLFQRHRPGTLTNIYLLVAPR